MYSYIVMMWWSSFVFHNDDDLGLTSSFVRSFVRSHRKLEIARREKIRGRETSATTYSIFICENEKNLSSPPTSVCKQAVLASQESYLQPGLSPRLDGVIFRRNSTTNSNEIWYGRVGQVSDKSRPFHQDYRRCIRSVRYATRNPKCHIVHEFEQHGQMFEGWYSYQVNIWIGRILVHFLFVPSPVLALRTEAQDKGVLYQMSIRDYDLAAHAVLPHRVYVWHFMIDNKTYTVLALFLCGRRNENTGRFKRCFRCS